MILPVVSRLALALGLRANPRTPEELAEAILTRAGSGMRSG